VDTDFAGFIVRKTNASLFKDFLYLDYCGEISFHNSLILLKPLKRRQSNSCGAGKLILTPAKKGPRCADLRRISHPFVVDLIRYLLTIPR
jgi:hypothetical protein